VRAVRALGSRARGRDCRRCWVPADFVVRGRACPPRRVRMGTATAMFAGRRIWKCRSRKMLRLLHDEPDFFPIGQSNSCSTATSHRRGPGRSGVQFSEKRLGRATLLLLGAFPEGKDPAPPPRTLGQALAGKASRKMMGHPLGAGQLFSWNSSGSSGYEYNGGPQRSNTSLFGRSGGSTKLRRRHQIDSTARNRDCARRFREPEK